MIDRVDRDVFGRPAAIAIRDQVGPRPATIADPVRIYFVIGRAGTYEMP